MIQGAIWRINLDPTIGAEIKKTRPCVILNSNKVGKLPLKVIAPLTDLKEDEILERCKRALNVVFE
jgi:mRNA interferase MazF